MKFSFVLPAYKSLFFRESLESIISQTYVDFELIIVNDASPDDLGLIVDSFNDSRIRYYVNAKNIGGTNLVAQWNNSIKLAKGDYIILASDDDVFSPLYLEKMDELIQKYPDVNVFRPRVQRIDENGKTITVESCLAEQVSSLEYLYAWVHEWIGSGIPFYCFKAEALKEIGGIEYYPFAWFSDDDTVLKLIKDKMVTSQDILFSFRTSGLNISSRKQSTIELKAKLFATMKFYEFINSYISTIVCVDDVSICYKNKIVEILPVFFREKRIKDQICNASIVTVLSVLPMLLKFDFIRVKHLVKFILYYVRKSFRLG